MINVLGPIPAVGSVCFRDNQVILVRRRNPPRAGEWSIPGGRIEFGEPAHAAAIRELQEETGVVAKTLTLIEIIEHISGNDVDTEPEYHFVILDFLLEWVSGDPVADDDALEARFVDLSDLDVFGLSDEARRVILKGYDLMQDILAEGMQ
ncbi:MAG: NUDIX hydrolase [Pseudomonadota bacterium]